MLSVFPESEVQYQEKMQAKYENKMRTSPNTRGLSFGARDSLPPKGWIYGESQTKAHIAEVTSKKALEKYNQASALKKVLEKFKQSPGSVSEGTTGLASSVGAQGGPTTPADVSKILLGLSDSIFRSRRPEILSTYNFNTYINIGESETN